MAHDERGGDQGRDEEGRRGGGHGGMAARGLTRPMALEAARSGSGGGGGHEGGGGEDGHEDGHDHGEADGHGGSSRHERLAMHHTQTLWIYWCLVLLGLWLVASPFTFGYRNPATWVAPSGGRGVWFGDALHLELRALLMTWSDVLSGLALVVFGWRSLRPGRPVSLWLCCAVGVWLQLAPLLFWSPSAAAYLNATLTGMWVIALTVLIPGMPNMILYMKMGPATPPGWSYNPSSWPQRWIMIATGFAGFLVSRYLGAYQLGFIETAWDPFFGEGTRRVLDSDLSHAWPVSDAALGTFAFTFEFLMGWMGAPTRWRTMPWMVTFFGILVIPLGLVHVALVISQPVVVGAWCTFCLLAAAIMLPMIPLEVDEVIAMGQHLVQSKERGVSLWRAFWKGGPPEGSRPDERTPGIETLPDRPGAVVKASLWGMSVPWTLAASTALGLWAMAAPALFGDAGVAADVQRLAGALVVTCSVIALGEPVRLVRWANPVLGLAIAVGPWLAEAGTAGRLAAAATGLTVALLAVPRGPRTERYGSWDRFVR